MALRYPILIACLLTSAWVDAQDIQALLRRDLDYIDSLYKSEAFKVALSPSRDLMARADAMLLPDDTLRWRIIRRHGLVLQGIGRYDEAIEIHEKSLIFYRANDSSDSLQVAACYAGLGVCWYGKGGKADISRALSYQQMALRLYQLQADPWLPGLATAWLNVGNALSAQKRYTEAAQAYDQALRIRMHNEIPAATAVATVYINWAGVFFDNGETDRALEFYKIAEQILSNTPSAKPLTVASLCQNLAVCHRIIGDLDGALRYYRKSLDIRQAQLEQGAEAIVASLHGIGQIYLLKGDYEHAEIYLAQVVDLRRKRDSGHASLSNALQSLASATRQREDFSRAVQLLREALALEKNLVNSDTARIAQVMHNLGSTFLDAGLLDSALLWAERTLDLRRQKFPAGDPQIAYSCSLLGEIYLTLRRPVQSEPYLIEMLAIRTGKTPAALQAFAFRQMSHCRLLQGRYAEADSLLVTCLQVLQVTTPADFENTLSSLELSNALVERARLHYTWGNARQDKLRWMEAADWAHSALDYLTIWEREFSPATSRYETRRIAWEARTILLSAHAKLLKNGAGGTQLLRQSFQHFEAAHNSRLYDAFLEAGAKTISDLPPEELATKLAKERQSMTDLAFVEKKIHLLRGEGKDERDTLLSRYLADRLRLFEQIDTLRRTLITQNPAYADLRSRSKPTLTPEEVQTHLLRPRQTLLEYFVSDSSLFIFWINQHAYDFVEISLDTFPLEKWIDNLIEGITAYHSLSDRHPLRNDSYYVQKLNQYAEAACRLYNVLITPVEKHIDSLVLIVPDGPLCRLPFGALLKNMPRKPSNFVTYSFWAREKYISYAYSATLHGQMCSRRFYVKPAYPAFISAPFCESDNTRSIQETGVKSIRTRFDSLPQTRLEALTVQNAMKGGILLLGSSATVTQFKKLAPVCRIIHLCTHAVADSRYGDYCYLVFAPDSAGGAPHFFYVRDLYALQLNADLVTLSACETGIGELRRGEGVIGLTRAFAIAGSKSVVSSLWQVNSKATTDLMTYFYEELRQKRPPNKDLALGRAQRRLLNAPPAAEMMHPYFWAAFIFIGDPTPLH